VHSLHISLQEQSTIFYDETSLCFYKSKQFIVNSHNNYENKHWRPSP
jgi:hypothetical protein